MANPPVLAGAKGDFVWLVFEEEKKSPRDPAKTFFDTSLEVLRLQNGRCRNTGDSQMKMPGSGKVVSGVSPKPPMQWNTGKLSRKRSRPWRWRNPNEFKDMLQYAHLELANKTMDPGYIQHNANFPQGREGFIKVSELAAGAQAAGCQANQG